MKKNGFTREQLHNCDKDFLVELVLSMSSQIQSQNDMLKELSLKIDVLTEELKVSKQRQFGVKSEKGLIDENQLTMALSTILNEAEASIASAYVIEPAMEQVVKSHVRRKKGQREQELKDLPVRIEEHILSEETLSREFPDGYRRLPDEVYKKLDYIPARYEVIEHHLAVYKDKKSDKIIKTPHPAELFSRSIATPSLLASVINGKYVNALPLYRQEQEFARNDIILRRQVLCNWVIKGTEEHLSLLYDRLHKELLKAAVIHADETPVEIAKDGRNPGAKSQMWVYRSGNMCNAPEIILYDYEKTRSSEHPKEFLGDFSGKIICDGYQVYQSMEKKSPKGLKVHGCWSHARRKFAEYVKSMGPEDAKGSIAAQALALIAQIYHEENKLSGASDEERLDGRQKVVKPLCESFFAWLKTKKDAVVPKTQTGKAIAYCLNQEEYLLRFLEDPQVPIDNNIAEQAIRPFCIGKNNWKVIDTVAGAQSSAILYSLAETAKANNLKPYEYFKHLLTEIPKHVEGKSLEFLDDLLPWSKTLPDECRKKQKTESN